VTTELEIGDWRVAPRLLTLERSAPATHAGEPPAVETRRVSPKAMAILLALAARPGQVLSKDELIGEVWEQAFVSDESLAAALYELRRALDDDAQQPRYVETIRRSGYRLIAPVRNRASAAPSPNAPEPRRPTPWLVAALGLVALATGWSLLARPRQPSPLPGPPASVAVLPVTALSLAGTDPLANALTEMLTADLAQVCTAPVTPGIAVRSRTTPWGLREAVEVLGVEAVVEASVLRSGSQVWISVQLVDTRDGTLLWSNTYDRALADELVVLREIALDVATHVDARLRGVSGAAPGHSAGPPP
jgi:DNA-binding winged helix-turn-helix (wHTH) protein/TolB-like protein